MQNNAAQEQRDSPVLDQAIVLWHSVLRPDSGQDQLPHRRAQETS